MPEANQNQQNPVEEMVEEVAVRHGAASMTPEDQSQLKEQIRQVIEGRIEDVMLEALPSEKLEELDQKLDDGMSDGQIEEFFLTAGVDYVPLIEKTLTELRTAFLGNVAEVA